MRERAGGRGDGCAGFAPAAPTRPIPSLGAAAPRPPLRPARPRPQTPDGLKAPEAARKTQRCRRTGCRRRPSSVKASVARVGMRKAPRPSWGRTDGRAFGSSLWVRTRVANAVAYRPGVLDGSG
ncbi:hypothetical protein SM007_16260 [Streptomyces avermitilis]|nr:hypothetical protein SM007_16260 [Streptomyces avermitilis]